MSSFVELSKISGQSSQLVQVANAAALPTTDVQPGDAAITLDTASIYVLNYAGVWVLVGPGSGGLDTTAIARDGSRPPVADIDFAGFGINNLLDPVAAQDAATKSYVDTFGGNFAMGSVIFSNGSAFDEDNSNFYWDDVNKGLGIGTSTPNVGVKLTVRNQATDQATSGLFQGQALLHTTMSGANSLYAHSVDSEASADLGVVNFGGVVGGSNSVRRGFADDEGTITFLVSNYLSFNQTDTAASAVTSTAAGVVVQHRVGTGTVGQLYDFFAAPSLITGGTINTRYGIYISPDTAGTKLNYFTGFTRMGVTYTDPTHALEVDGQVQVTTLTANRAMVTDASRVLVSSATTDVEIGYVAGVTSSIQTQLDSKSGPEDLTAVLVNGDNAGAHDIRNLSVIFDAFNIPSIDIANRSLKDDAGTFSIDYNGHSMFALDGSASIDYSNRFMSDTPGNHSIEWDTRLMFSADTVKSIDWDGRFLFDDQGPISPIVSIDYGNRILYDSANVFSMNYESRLLYDAAGISAIDYTNRFLQDGAGFLSMDFGQRQLHDGAGVIAEHYGNRQLIAADGTTTIVDWSSAFKLTAQLWTDQTSASGVATPATADNKMPVYDAAGTLIGYVAIYNTL